MNVCVRVCACGCVNAVSLFRVACAVLLLFAAALFSVHGNSYIELLRIGSYSEREEEEEEVEKYK